MLKKTVTLIVLVLISVSMTTGAFAKTISTAELETRLDELEYLEAYADASSPEKLDALLQKQPISSEDITLLFIWYASKKKPSFLPVFLRHNVDLNMYIEHKGMNITVFSVLLFLVKDPNLIQQMINMGADINAKFEGTYKSEYMAGPALLIPLVENNFAMINLLLDNGANPNEYIVHKKTEIPFLGGLILANADTDIIKKAIQKGANVQGKMRGGSGAFASMLMLAASITENPEVIDVLLDAGASPYETLLGMTAADFSKDNKHLKNTKALERLEKETRGSLP